MITKINMEQNQTASSSQSDQNTSAEKRNLELLRKKYRSMPRSQERVGQAIIVTGPGPIIVRKPSSNENPSKEM